MSISKEEEEKKVDVKGRCFMRRKQKEGSLSIQLKRDIK